MKEECEYCKRTNWYCLDHEPWEEFKSSRVWGGMNHQKDCAFLAQLINKEAGAIVRYCACVQVDFVDDPNFNGRDMKCPDCEGWDVTIRKGM